VAPANYAILLLDANQLDAAQQQFNRALAIDPSYYAAILAKGRWQIQRGEVADAKNTFLNSVAADPTIAQSAQGLAIGYYEGGEVKRAEQQLDAADRLDPRDPITPLIRTVIALDQSEADTALINARESFKRYRARGGVYSSLAQSRTDGSYLNSAFNKLGLTDWSRYYGDLVFNPFDSSSLFYQVTALQHQAVFTDRPPQNDNAMAALTQGILLDPLSISSRNRFTDLFRRPFVDVTAGGSMTMSDSGEVGWGADGNAEGFLNKGLPLSFSFSYGHSQSDHSRPDSLNNTENANLYIGTAPTLDDRIVLWGRFSDLNDNVPRATFVEDASIGEHLSAGTGARAVEAGVGYSHSFGARNNLNAVFEASTGDASLFRNDTFLGGIAYDNIKITTQSTSYYGGLSHTIDLGPLTLSYGAEGEKSDTNRHNDEVFDLIFFSGALGTHDHLRPRMGRLFADIRAPLGHGFSLEGGANFDRYKDETIDRGRVDPRIALAWQPVEGQWLRVGYRQDLVLPMMNSLSPVNTLGLVPASTPLGGGSTVKTAMARWDAEWSPHFFTSIDYEHQWLTGYSLSIQDALGSVGAEEGHLDRLTGSANAWLGNGFGAFATLTYARSRDTSPGSSGGDLPFVPDWQSNFGVTWVSPAQLSVTLAESIIGQRISASNGATLDTVALTNLAVDWQPLEKRLDLGFEVLNIFDKSYEIASGIPAPGRTFLVSGHVRF
jgi:tetratricopeptide (TPR) repeat protein